LFSIFQDYRTLFRKSFQVDSQPKSIVVLIHGLAAHRWMMLPLAWHLGQNQYQPHLFGYRSLLGTIETHAIRFQETLQRIQRRFPERHLHIVAHSMGCIITRQALLFDIPDNLQRIVMITPPNQGSPVAAKLSEMTNGWCRTLGQLSDSENSFVRSLPDLKPHEGARYPEIGILAASYDFVIPRENVNLAAQKDLVVVFGGHNGMLVRPAAFRQIRHFLSYGQFSHLPFSDTPQPASSWNQNPQTM
jgi:hypothetical protein